MRNHFAGQIVLSAKGSGLKNEMIHKSALALFLILLGSGINRSSTSGISTA